MAYIDAHNSLGTGKITITQFKNIWRDRLLRYKEYVTDEMLGTHGEARYADYAACDNPEEKYGMRKGLTKGQFLRQYVSSTICLDDNMEWAMNLSGGMGVTGTPGVAKTSIIMNTCAELGIACVHFTVAGLMGADIKGLPYIVKNENNTTVGVEYEQGTRLPISMLSANMSGMSDEVFYAKANLGTPSEMRYLKPGIFGYTQGIAPEFGVLLIDEFTNLDQHAQATLEKIISKSERGIRGLAEGTYIFPPYWIVICAMNSSTEGGMSRGDEEDDISEFIRQRLATHGFYTVFADAGVRDWMRENPKFGELIPGFLDWADRMNKKGEAGIDTLPDEDMGYVQYADSTGKISSPRLWEQVADQATAQAKNNSAKAYDESMSDAEKKQLEDERAASLDLVADAGADLESLWGGRNLKTGTGTSLASLEAQFDRANSVIAKRSEALQKKGEELSLNEYLAIIRSLIGIDAIADDFTIYYNVHKGIYGRFAKIEGGLKSYLLGEAKEGPKLDSLGDDVQKNAVAIGMSIKGYLLATCRDVFRVLYGRMQEIAENPIKTEDKLHDLAAIAVNIYQMPLRVGRWLNNPKLFPVGIKDEVAAICKNVFDFTMPIEGVPIPQVTSGGRYPAFAIQAVSTCCKPRMSDLKALAPSSNKCAAGAYNALFGQMRVPLCFAKATAETNWEPVKLKTPVALPSGQKFPYAVADDADLEYMDIVTSQGSVDGNTISQLFKN